MVQNMTYNYQIRKVEFSDGSKWYQIYEKPTHWFLFEPKWKPRTVLRQYTCFKTLKEARERVKQYSYRGESIVSDKIIE